MNKAVAFLSLMLVLSFGAFAQDKMAEPMKKMTHEKGTMKTLKGVVVDASCAKEMAGKEDVMTKASNHTKKCALMEDCVASGYGLFSEGTWYKFDKNGDKQAQDLIEKSKRTNDLTVTVKGTVGDGMITVNSIKEQKTMTGSKKEKKTKS